jgi:FkbM family methyltransferase
VTRHRLRSVLMSLVDRPSLRRLLRRLPVAAQRSAKQIALGDRADAADLAYCYRLILGRSPDPDGWRHYSALIERGELSVQQLVLSFLCSLEFRQRGVLEEGGGAVELVTFGTVELYVPRDDPDIGSRMLRRGAHQPYLAALLRRILSPGMTFVDVGANIGYFSLLGAQIVGEVGRVLAIEPGERNCRLIHRSVVRNQLRNVHLHPYAISDQQGALTYLAQGSNGTIADLDATTDVPPGGRLVSTTTLDNLLAGLDRVDVIKLDVEGAEARVLRGAARTFQQHRPVVVSEVSPLLLEKISGMSAQSYLACFLDLGYELSVVDRDGNGELFACGRDLARVLGVLRALGSLDVIARPIE